MCVWQKGKIRGAAINSAGEFVVFLMRKSEFLEQLLEGFYVLNHRNPGARVMFLVSPTDFVGQLLDVFMVLGGYLGVFSVPRLPHSGRTIRIGKRNVPPAMTC